MSLLKNILLPSLSGILLAMAWPEIGNQAWLIFGAFIPLFLVSENTSNWRNIFLYSFLSFIIWHILTNWWMWYSTPIGSLSAWIINSMLMSSVIVWAHFSSKKLKWIPFEVILAFYWLGFEFFHLFWDLKWPWMNLGHSFANHIEWVQWYEFVGVYGGTFWIIISNGVLFRMIKQIHILLFTKNPSTKGSKKIFVLLIISSAIIITPIQFSKYLYEQNSTSSNSIKVSIIQPNINTYTEKFDALPPLQQSEKIILLMSQVDSNSIILLPETVIPESFNILDSIPKSMDTILNYSKEKKIKIIGGFLTKDEDNLYNSACYIEDGTIIDSRNKIKLLAYAEKIPFDFISKQWSKIVHKQGGIEKSYGMDQSAKVFSIFDSIHIGTLICFESVFSDISAEICRNGAQALFIITNDDWWLDTPGYKQHFAYARIKAIETRKWISRSGNTGISGIINSKGEVLKKTEYREDAVIIDEVFLNPNQTFFVLNELLIRYCIISISILLLLSSIILKLNSK